MIRRRGGDAEQARQYRQAGHDDATIFALLIGVEEEYKNDAAAKKMLLIFPVILIQLNQDK